VKNKGGTLLRLLLALALLLPACAAPSGVAELPVLPRQEAPVGLVPQEYLCAGPGAAAVDPVLAREIQSFLEKNGMLGGLSPELASDLPVVLNGPVQACLRSFCHSHKAAFQACLVRSGRYLPLIRRIFKEYALPRDLVYVALVESGFSPFARSPKGAVGLWQFIEATGRRYGLKINGEVDERRDPEKSTRAAARYLLDLYRQFGCWYLAAAGYNAGEQRVAGVISRYEVRNFWIMAQKKLLPAETCQYVPKLIAAALIARNPEKFGFSQLTYERPRPHAQVEVPGPDLLALNPELKGGLIPAAGQECLLKVPAPKRREAHYLAQLCGKPSQPAALESP